MADELLDLYDASNIPLNKKAPRSEVHRLGLWHRSFHCWIVSRNEAGIGHVILQKRSVKKKTWPGRVDISAAGHYTAGETGIEGGLREIQEEVGIAVEKQSLRYVGTRVCVEEGQPGVVNHEFQEIFFLRDDRPIYAYKQDPEELEGLLTVALDAGLDLLSGRTASLNVAGVAPDGRQVSFHIDEQSFIPHVDRYNYKAMILARWFLAGERDLQI